MMLTFLSRRPTGNTFPFDLFVLFGQGPDSPRFTKVETLVSILSLR